MKLRLLADENFPGDAVTMLRNTGFDVTWVRLEAPGKPDEAVMARARDERRVLLTFEKDFGELVFRRGIQASRGVILFRIPLRPGEDALRRLVAAVKARDDWEGHFSVIEPGRIRMRRLPQGGAKR